MGNTQAEQELARVAMSIGVPAILLVIFYFARIIYRYIRSK